MTALLENRLPPKGSVLAPDIALCDECPRKDTKPTDIGFTEFKRPHQMLMDPEKCFLAQGVVCMGPATRSGCEAACTVRQHALHRLLRPDLARARPGRQDPVLALREHGAEGRGGDRQGARRHPGPGGHLLPLRSGRKACCGAK